MNAQLAAMVGVGVGVGILAGAGVHALIGENDTMVRYGGTAALSLAGAWLGWETRDPVLLGAGATLAVIAGLNMKNIHAMNKQLLNAPVTSRRLP